MTIGSRIRESRQASGLTQDALAARLGVSQPTVNRWETGENEPGHGQIERLAEALSTVPEWLAFGRKASSESHKAVIDREMPGPIAFQGVPGAYSHLACTEAFPGRETISCRSFEDAFEAVESGRAALGMIPIENSLGGRVADIHHLLPESALFMIGEHFQPVQHHLLAVPGTTLDQVKTAHSHPQALAQCREMLREMKLQPVAEADTAGAAKEVAELGDPTRAAIASSLAGETYGLQSLRTRIEDRLGNTTRFVVMAHRRIEPDPRETRCLTSIVFQVRSVPAALYKALGGFATNGVNLIRLESYISIGEAGVAGFYMEIEGHPSEKPVDRALEELQFFTSKLKVLGAYPANPFREQ